MQKLFLQVDYYSLEKKCFCTDQYRKWAFPWINFLLNFWRKEKKNQVNFCLHQEIVCSANVKYFPMAMTERQNNYSEVILLRRQSFFGSRHESSVVWKETGYLTYLTYLSTFKKKKNKCIWGMAFFFFFLIGADKTGAKIYMCTFMKIPTKITLVYLSD